ncbi:type I restriction endonuclease subunit R [Mycoplasma phocimorsus]|uniref:type I restriction endonuclease subunit R n=1 Tax=Mycoplasma phocimorsus TaxID=3045839 RepID=UPI0024BF91D3|nr:type I restriction endonuclease subunit R [Mycoplasma phocimorsus]MDJ1647712.1 type I restriction endonuclease subunit R [Mycoplasma phocimorsus]
MEQQKEYVPIVLDNYQSIIQKDSSVYFESEEQMENDLIKRLISNGYTYRQDIKNKTTLIKNIRVQIEKLNNLKFTDKQWEELKDNWLLKKGSTLIDKTNIVHNNFIYTLNLANGSKNISIFDKNNIENNTVEVINQYEASTINNVLNRYDVTILVNGFPLVHIELKKRGQKIETAFGQIRRYEFESFSNEEEAKLFQFVQIFVISNGTLTKYFANSVREVAVENKHNNTSKVVKVTDNYKFTSYWTDRQNKIIGDIVDFTNTFFQKNTILNLIFKYCVFDTQNKLKVMRPYQIAATESILFKVDKAVSDLSLFNYEEKNTTGGYVWHTTGSGKTLTSFKTATLIVNNYTNKYFAINKVLFVVDRRDLNTQTFKSFNKFKKESAVSPVSTNDLKNKLLNDNNKLIITTIQKLAKLAKDLEIKKKNLRMIFIFDECHRSQFGTQHEYIIKSFQNSLIFGFTGTPIFQINSNKRSTALSTIEINSNSTVQKTTEDIFGQILHKYTMAQAIEDENVLPFNLEIASIVTPKENLENIDIKVDKSIDLEAIWNDPNRISKNVEYILNNYNSKTNNGMFNSIFASYNIPALKTYYKEFKKQQEGLDPAEKLKIAAIFSFEPNQTTENDFQISSETINNDALKAFDKMLESDKQALAQMVDDYNKQFNTSFSINNAKEFAEYNNDVAHRLGDETIINKNNRIDILLVVNMYLTGFDAVKLNTLWLDKPLKYHSLIQAISRTNRIYDSTKFCGNVVSFIPRVKDDLREAIGLFCGDEYKQKIMIKSFNKYYYGVDDHNYPELSISWKELVSAIKQMSPNEWLSSNPEEKERFINEFGLLLKRRNYLSNFIEWHKNKSLHLLTPNEFNNYKGIYNEFYRKQKAKQNANLLEINDDLHFEAGLSDSTDIDVKYIWKVVHSTFVEDVKSTSEKINEVVQAVKSSNTEYLKADLIEKFLEFWNSSPQEIKQKLIENSTSFEKGLSDHSKEELNKKLAQWIVEYNLNGEYFKDAYIRSLKDGVLNFDKSVLKSFFAWKLSALNLSHKKLIEKFEKEIAEFFYKILNTINWDN